MTGVDPLPGLIYHARRDSKGPLPGHATFRRVRQSNVYRGIDLEYYRSDRELEFDFVVAAHADPRQIRLSFSGVSSMAMDEAGELALDVEGRGIRLKRPVVYQERNGSAAAGRPLLDRRRRNAGALGAFTRRVRPPFPVDQPIARSVACHATKLPGFQLRSS